MDKYIVVIGNPVDGFVYSGPFDDSAEAVSFGECVDKGTEWWVAPLVGLGPHEDDMCTCGHTAEFHKDGNEEYTKCCSPCLCEEFEDV